ncbi:gliding motility-associated C-terminal domain-containing protein [Pedobacter glucosidilyticus]|uniref:gliding motility-associated C-terminal domain-containing protein n=1 Tax=Pedobacter glucosidilyticus TaxID=1122941 RepID=UPI000422F8DA|nr:T9SS C-terminal target domain-containing protein [Pedobacter glucosidilyticus]
MIIKALSKLISFVLFILFTITELKAQTNDHLPYAINSAGMYSIINGEMFDSNLGEMVLTETFTGLPNMLLSQGFLQPYYVETNLASPLVFYNAFSPDGDGKNDSWVIENIDLYPENTLTIFNRWGGEVFKAVNYSSASAWKGDNVHTGTYFYILRATINGQLQIFKGFITVVKED